MLLYVQCILYESAQKLNICNITLYKCHTSKIHLSTESLFEYLRRDLADIWSQEVQQIIKNRNISNYCCILTIFHTNIKFTQKTCLVVLQFLPWTCHDTMNYQRREGILMNLSMTSSLHPNNLGYLRNTDLNEAKRHPRQQVPTNQ